MTWPQSELPRDIDGCHALIRQLQSELAAAAEQLSQSQAEAQDAAAGKAHCEAQLAEYQETVATQQETIDALAAEIKLLKRCLFGSRRERFTEDPAQGLLFGLDGVEPASPPEQAKDAPEPPSKPKRTSKGRQRRVLPDFLPREEERIHLDEAQIPESMRNNPLARRFFKKVGERIELIPAVLKVVEQLQEVIVLDQPDETSKIIAAQRPPTLIHAFVGPSVLAYLTVSRFADHLPYYRLENILGRSGLRIDRSTQWRWMHRLAQGVTPLVQLMWTRALLSQVIAMDETPVKQLGGVGTTIKGYLWTCVGDASNPYDCFFYSSDRRSIRPETVLQGYQGYLLADAYIAYERIGELWPGVVKAACWAHGRRKFEECHHLGRTKQTHTALAYFRQLFDIEQMYRQSSDEERLAGRLARSKPIMEDLHDWLEQERTRQLPKAKLKGAIDYMLNRWDAFTRVLESGAIPLDNNVAERALKYPILGRKAWLFVGNQEAGETAANLFTLTKTCNRLHIDPFAYLQDVYKRLPVTPLDKLSNLLPDRWLEEHPQHLIPERVQESLDRAQLARERRAERRAAA